MDPYSSWRVDISNIPTSSMQERLEFVCRLCLLAPSAHNTQPWRFKLTDNQLIIALDTARVPSHGDPTTRESWLSLGACVEYARLAGQSIGLAVGPLEIDLEQGQCRLRFTPASTAVDQDTLMALVDRRSNRHPYKTDALPPQVIKHLEDCWHTENTRVIVTVDRQAIALVAELTGRATYLALSLPEFKKELAEYMRPNWSRKPDGLPGFVMGYNWINSLIQPLKFRYGNVAQKESRLEANRMLACGGLALIFSKGDLSEFWLETGQAYARLAVESQRLGLAQATSAATVEAPEFHKDIERYFKTSFRLQAVLRLGYSDRQSRHSPRRNLQQVLT